jgi:hypothetical protein
MDPQILCARTSIDLLRIQTLLGSRVSRLCEPSRQRSRVGLVQVDPFFVRDGKFRLGGLCCKCSVPLGEIHVSDFRVTSVARSFIGHLLIKFRWTRPNTNDYDLLYVLFNLTRVLPRCDDKSPAKGDGITGNMCWVIYQRPVSHNFNDNVLSHHCRVLLVDALNSRM